MQVAGNVRIHTCSLHEKIQMILPVGAVVVIGNLSRTAAFQTVAGQSKKKKQTEGGQHVNGRTALSETSQLNSPGSALLCPVSLCLINL